MANEEDDLDLLLSLHDRVLETPTGTPPGTPPHTSDFLSDDESPKRVGSADMSIFKNAVKDCLDYDHIPAEKSGKTNRQKASNDVTVEKFSGLRMRNQLIAPAELGDRFSDIRFVRLSTIKNLLVGDTLSGCWVTVGVLTEKGSPKTSSTGKAYCIWKLSCLDENTVSVFLFGDAYKRNCKELAGTVFALFNSTVRKDAVGVGFSLSVYQPSQMLKMGTSDDYGVCKGKKKDGMACTTVINRRRGIYCRYHKSKTSEKYSTTTRIELKGGNLRTAFRDHHLKAEGVYMVDPQAGRVNFKKAAPPVKLLSVEGLKKALSNADKVTTNAHSQGKRFLAEITGKLCNNTANKESTKQNQQRISSEKTSILKSSTKKLDSEVVNQQPDPKRKKVEPAQAGITTKSIEKMIELDYVSSDEETELFFTL
ncbi:protein MCM10 homolog isoform X2 [Momordica charantia]|uniref:Protein MCM10 homolog isoform X2 n=1 Tax=Momordica charantia TaxID=3673 RepID=A0A6J1CZ79_MOMCH|nr:protein MCM10 homolog isoform X2 [Momordica charantia]